MREDLQPFRRVREAVVSERLDKEARRRGTNLASISVFRGRARSRDGLNIGIGENQVGAFAAQFQRDALEIGPARRLHNQLAHFCRAGE